VEVSQDPQTLKAYRQSLRQFQRWTAFTYMDEIDHDHVLAFRQYVESKGNSRLTADWKAMRVNKFVKVTLGLAEGIRSDKEIRFGEDEAERSSENLHQNPNRRVL
jgi:site-specific recombinase XerD